MNLSLGQVVYEESRNMKVIFNVLLVGYVGKVISFIDSESNGYICMAKG